MQTILEILQNNPVVALATVDKGLPRVRPVQFCFESDGKLWFCTAKDKEMYRQMKRVPAVEFAVTTPDFRVLRVRGDVRFSDDMEIKEKILECYPPIKNIYQRADNPMFTLFYLEHGEAVFGDFSGNPARVEAF